MHKSLKHLIVVAGFAPLFAFAQSAGGDADKTAAIKELLTTMNVDAAIKGQGEALENGAKQEAPLVLEQALVENKSLNDKQKQAAVEKLKKNGAVQRMTDSAGKDFETAAFQKDALQAHYDALGKYYSTQEIKDLTAFLKTPSGQKFMANQGKAMQEVWGTVMQKYGPQVGKKMRDMADKEVTAASK
ncbi:MULTISPECIES: DUF2059 domain-containing protein [Ralstonia]|jgi:hypothetical protein|uniref:Uncharacterized protein conserved in bacteria n=1 Tax=Ralstonia mannitolilytica TaxID=105219 RepID=A0A0D5ANW1_9RALS|nr:MULTISPECIES: DUF2059 domain-containing protein [Ralstonia]ATG20442.1 DUF2059 domain-containing protein [Ralstonia pickettii]AJW44789.1 signal peptide protein [Ralstonia mannitolilytica]ANA34246.1 hypothetical protein VZ52_13025 [Ralstonia mannitolilytica]MBU9578676.1 DUF2059 domain-containing protein [Ralstonia mannitolilytica]MBY4721067.1 DUF2059 domain-containing protein [Ralstonia mannitolilytica]